ncbi:MAG: hypothetical protein QOH09_4535 [Pseudonocardiales bacterium]|nr:hypothetical protein [Pseudonocardiales bacterium]
MLVLVRNRLRLLGRRLSGPVRRSILRGPRDGTSARTRWLPAPSPLRDKFADATGYNAYALLVLVSGRRATCCRRGSEGRREIKTRPCAGRQRQVASGHNRARREQTGTSRPVNRPTTAELLARSSEVRHVVIQACGPHGHTASPTAWPSVLRWTSIIPSTASRLMVP